MNRGDIVLVDIPEPKGMSGHEQVGNRPALIVHNDITSSVLSVIVIIPFTGKTSATRFPHTISVSPTRLNGLDSPSILLVFQLRAIDKKRIGRAIGRLEDDVMNLVDIEL